MKRALTILNRTKALWQIVRVFEGILYGLGVGLFVLPITNLSIALATALFTTAIFIILLRPWKISLINVASLYDAKFAEVQDSTNLLLKNPKELSLLGRIQAQKVAARFENHKPIFPPHQLTRASVFVIVMMLTGFAVQKVLPQPKLEGLKTQPVLVEKKQKDPLEVELPAPAIDAYSLEIIHPAYTKIPIEKTSNLNIKAVENSRVTWRLVPNETVAEVYLETSGKTKKQLYKEDNSFVIGAKIAENGFYNFRIVGNDSSEHITDLYNITAIKDQPPQIAIKDLKQHTTFEYDQQKKVSFLTQFTDDFGLTDGYIIATVSKGTGEAVKFREEKIAFEQKIDDKTLSLEKTLDLDQLKMSPGDELYFYVEAWDNKVPEQQKARTETYFVNIRDTIEMEFSLAGNLGVDLMPEYFRSQRQIIIDTEKLLEEKSKIAKKEFNSKSNELGYDQKQLRLKYGQFMGVEDESGIAIESEMPQEESGSEADEDPLTEYSHDHDGGNEHNLVDEGQHEHRDSEEHEGASPLEKFMHDHDDSEEATLYIESTRSMLKQALAVMWDAELYLRLYEPEKSLPYQYKALDLIKKIKNQSRIYVHRIGFDPPPIKEDKRLTGKLDEVDSKTVTENLEVTNDFQTLKLAVNRINGLLEQEKIVITTQGRSFFEIVGNVLAPIAIEQPTQYLKTLENLKKLANNEIENNQLRSVLIQIGASLNQAIPVSYDELASKEVSSDTLTDAFLKRLNLTENE